MNTWNRGLVFGAVVLLIAALPESLAAKERTGSNVEIRLASGRVVRGELLIVGQDGFEILDPAAGRKEFIPLDKVSSVRVARKSSAIPAGGAGFLAGAAFGGLMGLASGNDDPGFLSFTAGQKALILGVGLGAVGGLIGLVGGAFAGTDRQVRLDGLSPAARNAALVRLASKARYRAVFRAKAS